MTNNNIKFVSNSTGHFVHVNCDDPVHESYWFTTDHWNAHQVNDMINYCAGPNKARLAVDTVLEHKELESLLKFLAE